MQRVLIIYITFLFGIAPFLQLKADPSTGTLIVTYRTDSRGERLHRIRFWIKDAQGNKLGLYPKADVFVDYPDGPSRKVVVDDLAGGQYTIDFLIPNMDHYFTVPVPRTIEIVPGEVKKIDQRFRLYEAPPEAALYPENTLALHSSTDSFPSSSADIEPAIVQEPRDPQESALCTFPGRISAGGKTLVGDESGKETASAISDKRSLVEQSLAPGRNLSEKESKAEESAEAGKLILSYDFATPPPQDRLAKVKFRLINAQGIHSVHPDQERDLVVPLQKGAMIMLPQVPQGVYSIEFYYEDDENALLHRISDVVIESNHPKSVHESL